MPRNVLAYLLALAGLTGGPGAAQGPGTNAPAVCGPRCVEFLLHWYDRPADVSDLIDELQQGRPHQMVSLAAMAEALHKRGVHTKVVKLGWGATLDWPHPVVRHSTRASGAGHFTVLVPPRGEFPRLVWTGDAGYKRVLDDRVDGEASGVLLLTSPDPIGEVRPMARRGTVPLLAGTGGVVLTGSPYRGRAMRDVLSRLAMVVVLVVGLLGLGFVATAEPSLAAVPDGGAVSGGSCYVAGTADCNTSGDPAPVCSDTACERVKTGNYYTRVCPSGTTEESYNSPGTYEKAKPAAPMEKGKITYNQNGQYNCKTSRPC